MEFSSRLLMHPGFSLTLLPPTLDGRTHTHTHTQQAENDEFWSTIKLYYNYSVRFTR